VSVSLQQKFIESNTLDILVEILESDVAFDEISKEAHSPKMSSGRDSGSRTGLTTRRWDTAGREQKVQGNLGPTCAGVCLIGGEKAYNEMIRVLELGARTYFRVWVFQQAPPSREAESTWCANYELFVSTRPSSGGARSATMLNQQLRCPAEELPSTLNTPRYLLGPDGQQKDFHYRESHRVDHLWHN